MNQLLDRQYTLKILKMLATDFKDMDAYKQGIIDADGKVLKKSYQLKTQKERQAYTYLDRLIVILKKAIKQNEKRGDFTLTRALSPALWVVREQLEAGSKATVDVESKYNKLYDLDICLAEEEIIVEQFLKEDGGAPAAAVVSSPTNNTMGVAGLRADDGPVVHQKDIKKFRTMARRSMPKLKEVKP
jgi:hypothetical protein